MMQALCKPISKDLCPIILRLEHTVTELSKLSDQNQGEERGDGRERERRREDRGNERGRERERREKGEGERERGRQFIIVEAPH